MTDEPRPILLRIGVTLLNLLLPGLGLLRTSSLRAALPWLLASPILALAVLLILYVAPTPTFAAFVILIALTMLAGAVILIAPVVLTWRSSRLRSTPRPWWSRWYALVAVVLLAWVQEQASIGLFFRLYRPFYAPAESMAPTIGRNEKFIADMRGGREPSRGEIVVFEGDGFLRISRVVALAGDRIAMGRGVPILNGQPVDQRPAGTVNVLGYDGNRAVQRREERLPGHAVPYFVLDYGPTEFDEMEEKQVPAGHIFVLGDNRDRSADSRVPASLEGAEMVPLGAIKGSPLYIHWSGDWSRIGIALR